MVEAGKQENHKNWEQKQSKNLKTLCTTRDLKRSDTSCVLLKIDMRLPNSRKKNFS